MGPQHAYGIAARIEQVAEQAIRLNQGTLYPALVRLEQKGWIKGSLADHREQPRGEVLRHHAGRARGRSPSRRPGGSARPVWSTACWRTRRNDGRPPAIPPAARQRRAAGRATKTSLARELASHLRCSKTNTAAAGCRQRGAAGRAAGARWRRSGQGAPSRRPVVRLAGRCLRRDLRYAARTLGRKRRVQRWPSC